MIRVVYIFNNPSALNKAVSYISVCYMQLYIYIYIFAHCCKWVVTIAQQCVTIGNVSKIVVSILLSKLNNLAVARKMLAPWQQL